MDPNLSGAQSADSKRLGMRAHVRPAALFAVIAIVLNSIVFCDIFVHHRDYLRDYRLNSSPDAKHYVLLGRNVLLRGDYSRCAAPPYVPDVLRTPVYPIFAGALEIIGDAAAIYMAHAMLHAGSCLLLYLLLAQHLNSLAARCATLFLATDLMLVISNFQALSEPLYLFLNLAGLVVLAPLLVDTHHNWKWRLPAGAILLSVATLTRPVGLYVPILYAVLLISRAIAERRVRIGMLHATLFICLTALPTAAWIIRNSHVASIRHLTTADAVMWVYFSGGGAYQVHHGISLSDAQKMISQEFGLASPTIANNPWTSTVPIAAIDADLRAARWPVLSRYPAALVQSSLVGIAKAGIAHNVALLAELTGRRWIRPRLGAALRGDRDSMIRLMQNHPVLVGVLGWQLVHSLGLYVMAFAGSIAGLRRCRARPLAIPLLLLLLYFILTVAAVGADATYRSRTPHLPILCALAGIAVCAPRSGVSESAG